jgi:hypothetical protein
MSSNWTSNLATLSRARFWLTSSWNGPLPQALLGVRIPVRTPHLRSPWLRPLPSPTGRSSSMDLPANRVVVLEWSSSTQAKIK